MCAECKIYSHQASASAWCEWAFTVVSLCVSGSAGNPPVITSASCTRCQRRKVNRRMRIRRRQKLRFKVRNSIHDITWTNMTRKITEQKFNYVLNAPQTPLSVFVQLVLVHQGQHCSCCGSIVFVKTFLSDILTRVCFPAAHMLPKEDGDFYQFCYVAAGSQVRGASTPFQVTRDERSV